MCSIAMPGELMLGGPPVYGHHLLYRPLMVNPASSSSSSSLVSHRIVGTRSPRPCLSTGSIPSLDRIHEDDIINNGGGGSSRRKKRVVFADDRGRPLTQVRVMSEPSNVPPLWTRTYLAGVTRGVRAEAVVSPCWETIFRQPASDYLTFRRKLEEEAVSLENVIVRETENCLIGTVKVKNLAYDKEVTVRASSDGWMTHEDVDCAYVEQPNPTTLVLYDTFRFRLALPVKSDMIEFCVRYRVHRNHQYWDNNDGKNFVVRKRREQSSAVNGGRAVGSNEDATIDAKLMDASRESTARIKRIHEATGASDMITWSEFASWQNLNNDAPYW